MEVLPVWLIDGEAMVKLTVVTGVHVVVEVRHPYGPEEDRSELERFIRMVENHRDFDGFVAYIVKETEDRCSFCGAPWEVVDEEFNAWNREHGQPEEPIGMPVCCVKAQGEFMIGLLKGADEKG